MTHDTKAAAAPEVMEIVTFRLAEGVTQDAFVDVARQSARALARHMPLSRSLTLGDDGIWTDLVRWPGRDAAEAAARSVMTDPAFAPFLAAIDPASVTMRHAEIRWQAD